MSNDIKLPACEPKIWERHSRKIDEQETKDLAQKGRLIVIESGSDGAGKQTQASLLAAYFEENEIPYRQVSFPVYTSPSSSLVKMYLEGQFGDDAQAVDPYVASTFYTVDRVASYLSDWKKDYDAGKVILLDRYTSSNMLYQGAKMEIRERYRYLDWIDEHEHTVCGLPRPDLVLYLDVPPETSAKLREGRPLKTGGGKDIHENDEKYLRDTYFIGLQIAGYMDWKVISCSEGNEMYPQQRIHHILRAHAEHFLRTE